MPNREFTNFILDIRTNRLDKVKAFIEANNNLEVLNTVTEEGENALYAAVCGANRNRRNDVLNYLLTIPGIDVNKSLTQSGDTPLIEAVLGSNEEAVKLLLAAEEIDVNKCNLKG